MRQKNVSIFSPRCKKYTKNENTPIAIIKIG